MTSHLQCNRSLGLLTLVLVSLLLEREGGGGGGREMVGREVKQARERERWRERQWCSGKKNDQEQKAINHFEWVINLI